MQKHGKEKLKNLENEIKEKNEQSEKEIKDFKDKNENLNEDNKLLNDARKEDRKKCIYKVIKLIILGLFGLIIFYLIYNLTDKYYVYKKDNSIKDCCEIEKNYAIKESEFQKRIIELQKEHTTKTEESQKKIAELEKELCTLKSKINEPKKEIPRYPTQPSQILKNQTIEINYNKNPVEEKN